MGAVFADKLRRALGWIPVSALFTSRMANTPAGVFVSIVFTCSVLIFYSYMMFTVPASKVSVPLPVVIRTLSKVDDRDTLPAPVIV